ncbi:hypothetical protein K435DRAFT_685978, partial [Dendrothele bispora CBS 962.96]
SLIKALLGYDPGVVNGRGGVLGHVTSYYGCVEAQGRGTLHCHMLIWVEGSLNPNELKAKVLANDQSSREFQQRLINFLDATIINHIQPIPSTSSPQSTPDFHPSSVRSHLHSNSQSGNDISTRRDLDMHFLSKSCQSHRHTKTCYKYCKPGEPLQCRFDMDPSNTEPTSRFDVETGELHLRCLDGMVNNYNPTMLEALRCNMDIKFIGSGASAKAILYYVTDYITKSPLKTHVAYAALASAVKYVEATLDAPDNLCYKGKRLLQHCAYSLINEQEVSAQQVMACLLDNGDHYTSHKFGNLYWTSFEKYIQRIEHQQIQDTSLAEAHPESDSSEDERVDDIEDHEEEDDGEVTLTLERNTGNLIPVSDQVADYLHRGPGLEEVCLWDSIRQLEKVRLRKAKLQADESDSDDDDQPVSCAEMDEGPNEDEPVSKFALLDRSFRRPTFNFSRQHQQVHTHVLKVRHPDRKLIPVPIEPAIP